jgi:hypothetical protein
MRQEIGNGGGNVQIVGSDNQVSVEHPGYQPLPNNPNLITCPACGWYGVFRNADQCPTCHYSLLNARLAIQEEARRIRKEGLSKIFLFAALVLTGAINISSKFKVGFLDALAMSFMIVSGLGIALLFVLAKITTWIKLRKKD